MSEKPTYEELQQRIQELEAELKKYQDVIESAQDDIFFKDLKSRYTMANDKTLKHFGLSKNEIIGRNDYEIMPDQKEAEKNVHDDQIVFKSGKHTEITKHMTGTDGKEYWFQAIKVPQFDDNGTVTGLFGIARDVTEQMRTEKVQAAQLRLIKYAADHTLMEFLQMFLDEAEVLTRSEIGFFHFLEDDQRTLSLQTWSTNTLENMCTAKGAGTHYPVSEASVWVDCVRKRSPVVHNDYASLPHKKGLPEGHAPVIRELVVPVFRGEKIVAILGIGNKPTNYNKHDVDVIQKLADLAWETITHKRSEEKIHKLNESLEQRVAKRTAELQNRTHQLQQLALELSGAEDRERRTIASILHDDFQQQLAFIKMELDQIHKQADTIARQRLGLLSQLTGECIEKSRDLSYMLNPPALHRSGLLAALEVLAKDIENKHGLAVTFRKQTSAEPTSLSLASILYRSARELLINVVKYAGVKAALMDVHSKNGLIILKVEDCGNGFDYDAVRAGQGSGVGFGLYNIEDRMTSLGGSMKVRTKPGKGCCVVLTVPKDVDRKGTVAETPFEDIVQKSVRDVPVETIYPVVEGEQIRVLLADDHKLMREALANLLQDHKGLTIVGQAVNGNEAVQLAAKLKPHVILMDVTMPELDGFEATAKITGSHPDICIIALSMHNDPDTQQKMFDAGARAYLTKTDAPDTLVETIRRLSYDNE